MEKADYGQHVNATNRGTQVLTPVFGMTGNATWQAAEKGLERGGKRSARRF